MMFSQVWILLCGLVDVQYCELDVVSGDLNCYMFIGCLLQCVDLLLLVFVIQDGVSYVGVIFKQELKEVGIIYCGMLLCQMQVNEFGMIVVSKQLVLLYDLFKIMLKKLDNMIVDIVFWMIGYVRFNVSGIWWVGLDVVCQILC